MAPLIFDGAGTISGLQAGGLPDSSVTTADIANSAITAAKIGYAGAILQVVSATKTDFFTTTSSTYVDVTGLSVSITPASTSNKILVIVNMMVGADWWNANPGINLVRNSTNICQATSGGTTNATAIPIHFSDGSANSALMVASQSITFLDSPSTTSATTYKIQVVRLSVNRSHSSTSNGSTSTITVMEVAG